MKRFHVHMHVEDLTRNIAFYSAMFQQAPSRAEADYAKWMLDDPPVNFAISTRGNAKGVDHLGIQVDSADELDALKNHAQAADMAFFSDGETSCCYARSDKYWITDPQGLAWEQFHTLDSIPVYGEARQATEASSTSACCAPAEHAATGQPAAGCGTGPTTGTQAACC